MKPDKYRKRYQATGMGDRLRRQLATEAARRMLAVLGPPDKTGHLRDATAAEFQQAKLRAAAVLGHTVRPGDLPSDSEVRSQVLLLSVQSPGETAPRIANDCEPVQVERMADHLDRFAIYRLRLVPLEEFKQDPRNHPEGDALYHSLQVFELARSARPYDEEFLLAALLHDVGKALDHRDHIAAGLESLAGTLTERTAWLIAHHHDLLPRGARGLTARERQELSESPHRDDLALLAELDQAGTAIGVPVPTVDEAIDYLRQLDAESFLEAGPMDSEPRSHDH